LEKKFKYEFEVRGYELDSFGHVNNAVYLNYFEQARWEIIKLVNLHRVFEETKDFLVVVEANIKYIGELKLFDKAIIETKMIKRGFFLAFDQRIKNSNGQKISKAMIKCLFVDNNRNPKDIPDVILPYINE
jgi:acyl-CoA thioester hydrolase